MELREATARIGRVEGGFKTLSAGLLLVLWSGEPAAAKTDEIVTQTRLFLDAYGRGDRGTILGLVDHDEVTIYGSDVAEVFHGAAALTKMMKNDLHLWGGSAHIGPMEHVTVIQRNGLASVFFDADFSAGGRLAVPVRFAMVWKRSGKEWLLVQSPNVVPTQGSSAEQLLR